MPKLMSAQEWLDKAAYEGGALEGIANYGLTEADLDPDSDSELYEDVKKISETLKTIYNVIERVNQKIESM